MAIADNIRFRCTHCDKPVSVPVEHAGKKGKCPGCGAMLRVPGVTTSSQNESSTNESSSQLGVVSPTADGQKAPNGEQGSGYRRGFMDVIKESGIALLLIGVFGVAFLGLSYLLYSGTWEYQHTELIRSEQIGNNTTQQTYRKVSPLENCLGLLAFVTVYLFCLAMTLAGFKQLWEAVVELIRKRA